MKKILIKITSEQAIELLNISGSVVSPAGRLQVIQDLLEGVEFEVEE